MTRAIVWCQCNAPVWLHKVFEFMLQTGHHPFDGHGHGMF